MISGRAWVRLSLRRRRANSTPLMPGSIQSITIRSGSSSAHHVHGLFRGIGAQRAVPGQFQVGRPTSSCIAGSSSTTSIVAAMLASMRGFTPRNIMTLLLQPHDNTATRASKPMPLHEIIASRRSRL